MDPRTVSVVIPTHDRWPLLRRALDSVLDQSRQPGEVLVVDDGSTDGTAEGLRREYPHVRCLQQENRGVSAARNAGLAAARGDWIALLDSDDEWLPTKLEAQLAALQEAPEMRVCHTEELWVRNGRRVNPRQRHAKAGGWIFRRCLPLCAMSPSSIVIHRTVFDDVGTFDESLPACEDYDLWLRITSRYPVLFLEQPLIVKHGGHPDQLSRRHWGMDRFRIRALVAILASGHLGPEDEAAAREELARKVDVYAAGARRRGREDEAREYEALLVSPAPAPRRAAR